MRILSRDFTLAEKALFIALGAVLAGLIYYQFFYVPVKNDVENTTQERDMLQSQVLTMESRLARLQQMEADLEKFEASGNPSRMPSYSNDNSAVILALFNQVLRGLPYNVNRVRLTEEGNQIRRYYTLQFATDNFASAKRIVASLAHGDSRCLLSSLSYAVSFNAENQSSVVVSLELAFYETMVGGTPDIGLPSANGGVVS